ncbi:hypothetical protein V6Z12_D07G127200 [Gossypium hirsutum]
MKALVNFKQQGTVEQFHDSFVGLLNYIFISNLKTEIGNYLDLFEPSSLVEAFQLARKIEVLLSGTAKKYSGPTHNSSRLLSNSSVASDLSSTPTRANSVSQSGHNTFVNKPTPRAVSPALMAERKQKGLCFWCGAKYQAGHKCVKSQSYQLLMEPLSDNEAKEFQECSDCLEESNSEDEPPKSPVILLHALTGMQGHNTMRVAARVGSLIAIILVDSGSTHNFIDARLVNRLSLPIMHQEQLRVSVVNGESLFTRGVCKGVLWEVQNHKFETDFMILPLKGCDMVLGVQWLLSLVYVQE